MMLATVLAIASCTGAGQEPASPTSSRSANFDGVESAAAPPGAVVSIAMRSPEAISAHHAITSTALDIASLLHTGLTRRGVNGPAQPALAESWSTIDQRIWIFELVPGSRFNDGSAITAQSFVDSWRKLASQDTRSRNAYLGLVGGISGWGELLSGDTDTDIDVRALGELTLQVRLVETFPWFPELVSHPAFAPVAKAELEGSEASSPIGTGPFRVLEPWLEGVGLKLVRVWGGGHSGTVSTFNFKFTESDEQAAALVVAGEVDLAPLGSVAAPDGEVTVVASRTDTLIYMGFPVSRAPVDEPGIRQALVAAIDREQIEGELIDGSSVANDSYAPIHTAGANLLTCLACVYDPDAARELLAEVEVPENSLSLHVVEGSAGEPWAEAIAASWQREIGWPVAVVRHDLVGLVGFLQAGIPDGPFILEWTSEYPAAESWVAPLFDPSGFDDFTRFSDRTLSRALTSLGAMSANSPTRTRELKDIRTVLAERVPSIPIALLTRRIAVGPSIDSQSIGSGLHLQLDLLAWLP